jgi:DNA-binding MarR family transcriptional regulator|tara:strand:+ start:827 stop:1639 length:813 start_codon:yes stop_codon:yes gene_type:complete
MVPTEGQKIIDRWLGKLESLLHIVDRVRALDPRMEITMLTCLLYVARHGDERYGVPMEQIAEDLGIAQSSTSRNIARLSENELLNPARDVLDRAAKRGKAPTRESLRPKFGMGLVYTVEDPNMRRRKNVFLTPAGRRFVNGLMDYTIESKVMNVDERLEKVKALRKDLGKSRDNDKVLYQYRAQEAEARIVADNLQRLERMQDEFKFELAKIKEELSYRYKEVEKRSKMLSEISRERDRLKTIGEVHRMKKQGLLSSGYLREGANVKKKR